MAIKALPRGKKVLVLYVGGIFGIKKTRQGSYTSVPNSLLKFMKQQRDLHDPELSRKLFGTLKENELVLPETSEGALVYEVKEYNPLLHPCNMGPEEWIQIAEDIGSHYENYDGFVIIHGTETLCYTASALSFMLEGLQKPVIFTGALRPVYDMWSQCKNNLVNSLIMAGCYDIPEVCILFNDKLLRGNRTTNTSCEALDPFESFNYSGLAEMGRDISIHHNFILKPTREQFKVNKDMNGKVAVIQFTPTMTAAIVEAIVKSPVEGLVIQTYGAGNLPTKDKDLQNVFKWAVQHSIIVVNVTQCPHGTIAEIYTAGKWLADMGIVNGKDMTCEAAVSKLCYVLGFVNLNNKEKIKLMETDLRGEMTKYGFQPKKLDSRHANLSQAYLGSFS